MKKPKISIIMPCYNEATRISQSVASVFQQSFTDFELIIVDDGSADNSLDMLAQLSAKYPDLRYFSQTNKGAGPARNRGLTEAKGEYIAFLDADDSWHPDCLLNLYQTLASNPDATIAYGGWQNIGLEENKCKPFIPPDYETPEKTESLLRGCRWPIHAALTRASAIKEINGFDEQWTSCMDYNLWLNIASFNKILLVPQILAYYHHHQGEQITKNRIRIALNHWRIQLKFLHDHPDIAKSLGCKKVKEITDGELLHRGYISYWARDLKTSHTLFRKVLLRGYFKLNDLKYLLPTLLPFRLYQPLILVMEK